MTVAALADALAGSMRKVDGVAGCITVADGVDAGSVSAPGVVATGAAVPAALLVPDGTSSFAGRTAAMLPLCCCCVAFALP